MVIAEAFPIENSRISGVGVIAPTCHPNFSYIEDWWLTMKANTLVSVVIVIDAPASIITSAIID
jgi:hypothetical protein